MIKNIFIIIIALFLMSSVCAAPVHAADFGDYSDGWEQTGINNSVHNVAETVRILKQVLSGEISVPEAASQIVGMGLSGGFENVGSLVNELITTGDINIMSPREFVVAVGNAINNEIRNNGGSVSNFPVEEGYFSLNGWTVKSHCYPTYLDAEAAGFRPSSYYGNYDIPYNVISVHSPVGECTYWVVFSGGNPSDSGTLDSIVFKELKLNAHYQGFDEYILAYDITCTVRGSRSTASSFTYLRLPPGLSDTDPDYITDTPDLDNLTDDDLKKYIDNIINQLEQAFPDLSTIEGLLQSILNKLNKLDTGGCDCSELAASINALIARLDNNDLSRTLKELQKLIENNTSSGGQTDLTPVIDKIDELQKELLKAYAFDYSEGDIKAVTDKYDEFADYLIKKKFCFVTSFTQIINSALNTYAKSTETSFSVTYNGITREVQLDTGFSYDQLQLIRYILAAFIYIRFAFSCYRRIPGYINNGGDE